MTFKVEKLLGETYDRKAWLYSIRDVETGQEHLLYFPKMMKGGWAYRIQLLHDVR